MRTDRELLELAAKTAGLVTYGDYDDNMWAHRADQHPDEACRWNPMTDDGDALRLAVALGIRVIPPKYKRFGTTAEPQNGATGCTVFRDDPDEQTRRAIVMAAAEMGAHPKQHNDGGAE